MNKQKILLMMCGMAFLMVSGVLYLTHAADVNLSLEITGLGIRHGTPENFPIGLVMGSPSDQEVSGQFLEHFRVEDLQGYTTGHYTTIQCDGIYGPSSTKLTGIELKAGNIIPERIMGLTGPNVQINPALSGFINIIEPVTYLYKADGANNLGIVNRYGDKPRIKILIPANATGGTYSGRIVFSFYMN